MARPETLIPGNCYFSVHFYDNDLVLPMIDTLVYVGQEMDQDEGRLWLFKEPDSPPNPDEQDPSSEPPALTGFSDRQLHGIVDFDGSHVDYLCDRDRTRVLEFSIPSEQESIVHLCRRVLAEVYSMRRGDVLEYPPLKKSDVPARR